jgi:hypothetical protein
MRVLYVGDLIWWGTCLHRCHAIEQLGHDVTKLDLFDGLPLARQLTFASRVARKLGLPLDHARANARVLEAMKNATYELLWIDKGLIIRPQTTRQAKKLQPDCQIIGYSPDDMNQKHNQSQYFLRHLPCYDLFFTTKSYGVEELTTLGCQKVVLVGNSYDADTHRPMALAPGEKEKYGGSIGFIGAWEKERADSILALVEAGFTVRVWGSGWENMIARPPGLILENRYLLGDEYAKGMCSFDINLCFLRKINRDLQTTRSIEIPACGAFMVAERTSEHLALFEDGKEAVFFSTNTELVAKVDFYLRHPEERRCIAAAGKKRCVDSGYSNYERMKLMLGQLSESLSP